MFLGLIGNGKTGSFVAKLHDGKIKIFNSKNLLNENSIKEVDIIICFTNGQVFMQNLPLLKASKKPVVVASTGYSWPNGFENELKEQNTAWIWSFNFSLGINLFLKMASVLKQCHELDHYDLSIDDIHHKNKIDTPSGTAIMISKIFDKPINITSERVNDVVGDHILQAKNNFEEIKIVHSAKDRSVFAKGALLAANLLFKKKLSPGLHHFYDVLDIL